MCHSGASQIIVWSDHLVDINFSDFFQIPVVNITRGHAFKLFVCHTRVKARANFFASYIVNVWNSLPCETVNAKSVTEFKARITRFKFSNFLLVKLWYYLFWLHRHYGFTYLPCFLTCKWPSWVLVFYK